MRELIEPDKALDLVMEHLEFKTPKIEPIENTLGLALAQDIVSEHDYPPFTRAMMDGFAVRLADAGKLTAIGAEIPAGSHDETSLTDGICAEIMTGAPCPDGTQAVVKVEDTKRDGDKVLLPALIKPGQSFAQKGCECQKGSKVLSKETEISPLVISVLAFMGMTEVKVFPSPSLAIITTGDEIVAQTATPGQSQIRDSNGPMLLAKARNWGIKDAKHLHALDTMESLLDTLDLVKDVDIVAFTGGVSMGKYDIVPHALDEFGAKTIFHGVRQKPGKPLLFAVKEQQVFFGLPGTPLGSHLGFQRFVTSTIRMMGKLAAKRVNYKGGLINPLEIKGGRTMFLLAKAEFSQGKWYVTHLKGKGSSDIFIPASANAYIRLEAGQHNIRAGSELYFEIIEG